MYIHIHAYIFNLYTHILIYPSYTRADTPVWIFPVRGALRIAGKTFNVCPYSKLGKTHK